MKSALKYCILSVVVCAALAKPFGNPFETIASGFKAKFEEVFQSGNWQEKAQQMAQEMMSQAQNAGGEALSAMTSMKDQMEEKIKDGANPEQVQAIVMQMQQQIQNMKQR